LGSQLNKEMEGSGKTRFQPNWDSIPFAWRKTTKSLS
jgi:hypothetical protein